MELGKKGIQAVIIESAGFAETGPEGKKRQDELKEIAGDSGLRLLGPNCVGVVNTDNQFATIEIMDHSMEPGPVSIIAQSGVFGNILLDHLPEVGVKISKVATLGNKMDLDEADFLQYFVEDPQTRVIIIYEEGVVIIVIWLLISGFVKGLKRRRRNKGPEDNTEHEDEE